ncbi:MAG: molybdenum cofactor guanylyltransferase, partial [Planctomycetales bacterium]|nr:molybdenum cofactor guanylyltransferase [Planctomycetales bacterium]
MSHSQGDNEAKPAALVLCGGHSARMGIAKAGLPFGDVTMLLRVIDRVAVQCDPIVVVAAADQSLEQLRLWCPDVESRCLVTRDRRADRGPLEGLIAGLELLATTSKGRPRWRPDLSTQLCYATSCDVPLLQPGWITALAARIGDAQAAVPVDDRFHHPLATLYRANVLSALRQLDARDELRP